MTLDERIAAALEVVQYSGFREHHALLADCRTALTAQAEALRLAREALIQVPTATIGGAGSTRQRESWGPAVEAALAALDEQGAPQGHIVEDCGCSADTEPHQHHFGPSKGAPAERLYTSEEDKKPPSRRSEAVRQ